MTQTTTVLSQGHTFNILGYINQSKTDFTRSNKATLTLNDTERETEQDRTISKLITWFNQTGIVTTLGYKSIAVGRISKNGHTTLRFSLIDGYGDHFVLLRGLIDFSRPKGISISSSREDHSFELEVGASQVETLIAYFEKILLWFRKEISFKASLKEVIRFEEKIRSEQARLYETLKASFS